jgi:23S rRNA pseudouridine2604 synthase
LTFRNRLQYFLVKKLKISNKSALELIFSGQVYLNSKACFENIEIQQTDTISFGSEILQKGKKLIYIAFYKPRGIETTLNPNITDNLISILPFNETVFPVGRLDKDSEGLLLLTNDGKIFDKTLRKEFQIEKEYLVRVDKPITQLFIEKMAAGVLILGKTTLPTKIEPISELEFKIILVEGLNRQIRRMCYKLGYEVIFLKRIRIGKIEIGNLKPLEYKYLDEIKRKLNHIRKF